MNEKILLILVSSFIGASISFLFSYFLYRQKIKNDNLKIKKSIVSSLEGLHVIRNYWLITKFKLLVACEFYDILLDRNGIDKELIKSQFIMRQNLLSESTGKLYDIHRYFIEKLSEVRLYFNVSEELDSLIERNVNMSDIKVEPNFDKNNNYDILKKTMDSYGLELEKLIDEKFTSISIELIKLLKSSLK